MVFIHQPLPFTHLIGVGNLIINARKGNLRASELITMLHASLYHKAQVDLHFCNNASFELYGSVMAHLLL